MIWQKIFNGTGNNSDQFNSVITDAASNIYAAGLSVRNFGGTNNLYVHQIYKYDANGTELWENWEYSNPTGTQKIIDTEGRVERFLRKYGMFDENASVESQV